MNALAAELRKLIDLFPRDLVLHRGFLLRVAVELDRLTAENERLKQDAALMESSIRRFLEAEA